MSPGPSDGELLLYTYHGTCGHRRQHALPCATPKCKQGSDQDVLDAGDPLGTGHVIFSRTVVKFGDDDIVIWKRFVV